MYEIEQGGVTETQVNGCFKGHVFKMMAKNHYELTQT